MSDIKADLVMDTLYRFNHDKPTKLTSYCERVKRDCTKTLKMCEVCKYTFCSSHIIKIDTKFYCDDCCD